MIKNAKDLHAADYNPRTITAKELAALGKSIENFGDLSGIVFNRKTKTLISGHQRTKTLSRWPSKAVLRDVSDKHGTVQLGVMQYKTDNGIIEVPMRVVEWDVRKEKQANIAANTHGGDFDKSKLATMVAELETGKKFDIELLGLDPHDLALLRRHSGTDDEDAPGEFKSVADLEEPEEKVKVVVVRVCCPECKHVFDPAKHPAKKKKRQ